MVAFLYGPAGKHGRVSSEVHYGLHPPLGFCFPLHKIEEAGLKLLNQPKPQKNNKQKRSREELPLAETAHIHWEGSRSLMGRKGFYQVSWMSRHTDLGQYDKEEFLPFSVMSQSKVHWAGTPPHCLPTIPESSEVSLPPQFISRCGGQVPPMRWWSENNNCFSLCVCVESRCAHAIVRGQSQDMVLALSLV